MDTGESDRRHITGYFDQLQWPFTGLIVGARQSGKSSFLLKLIEQRNFISEDPIKVLYIYDQYQPLFDKFKEQNPDVIFSSDLYDVDKYVDGSQKFLVAFDDMMLRFEEDSKANYFLRHFYTVRSHHTNCSVLTIIHNAFPKNFRLISLNSTYLVLFKNNRDISFTSYLNRQIYGCHSKFLMEDLKDATSQPYSYLVLDFGPNTPDLFRVRNWLIPNVTHCGLKCYIQHDSLGYVNTRRH
jgi:hypothetical protein